MRTVIEIAYEHSVASAPCPRCGRHCGRHGEVTRYILDLDGKQHRATYSKHRCERCRKTFTLQVPGFTVKGSKYSVPYRQKALTLLASGMTLEAVSKLIRVPVTTLQNWKADEYYARVSKM